MNKKIKIILLILILIFVILILKSTYSKYTEQEEASVVEEIADWIIKVNDVDITVVTAEDADDTNTTTDNTTSTETSTVVSGTTFNISGDDFVIYESSHVSDGKLAPGSKGYFYIRIDPEGTQTAVKYTISIDTSSLTEKGISLKITNISDENGKNITTAVSGTKQLIQRIKTLDEVESTDETSRIDKIKVEFEWLEDSTTNDSDTSLGENSDSTISLPITVNAIQYVGQGYDI